MTTFSFSSVASDLRRTGLVVLLLTAGVSSAQEPPADYTGITLGDRVRVVLKDGMSIDGRLMRMTDSTLVLSAAKAPIAVLQQRSLPLEVSQTSVTLLLSNGSRMTGQVVGLTEQRLVFRKEGTTGNVFVNRLEVVAVSNRGRKTGQSAVDLRHGEIALITKLTSYVNGAVTTRFLRDGEQPHQLALALAPGVRVRLTAPTIGEEAVVGTVVSVDTAGTIVVRPSQRVGTDGEPSLLSIPSAAVKRLEISQGRHSSGSDGAVGSVVGLMGGVVAGALLGSLATGPEAGMAYLGTLPLGAAVGLVIGTVIGARPRDHWQTVPLSRLQIGLNRPRRDRFESKPEGMALNVSFKF